MELIVGSLKAFVRLCNKKDFSHLPDRRHVGWNLEWFERNSEEVEAVGEDESEPVKIYGNKRERAKSRHNSVTVQASNDEGSDEEFSSSEDSRVILRQKRRRRKGWKNSEESHGTEQLIFVIEL